MWALAFVLPNCICQTTEALLDKMISYRVFHELLRSVIFSLTAAPHGGFVAPHGWEIVGAKNLTIFKGCNYSRFYMKIASSFQKIETKIVLKTT